MKVLIVSDNHREKNIIEKLSKTIPADYYIHLGDSEFISNDVELKSYLTVLGNVDFDRTYQRHGQLENIFYTHGHMFGIKHDRSTLAEKAQGVGAKYALYGHSHVAKVEKINDVYCINPGSISFSRNEYPESYAILNTDTDVVEYYNRKNELMDSIQLGKL
ncbi:YfcE family phosphodiesterase [Phocicoccus pinnipedialis]|uniref:Phosphoesterase n=1 Tax=Phocicoccus pinnipedialis TaxID=110845 RepID=A0A6V7REA6_9BACL|nr:YfcE family phosphodiesterase [Jeotgalicoccus pinnipedialis]MBP1939460.1 putative phosphoesterase [Jeotgalicoccus pinnipedialis]CAD2075323.1 hypothetical protein JEOPIN946_00979 [Jeotgalicoccus pinnipedialis]